MDGAAIKALITMSGTGRNPTEAELQAAANEAVDIVLDIATSLRTIAANGATLASCVTNTSFDVRNYEA